MPDRQWHILGAGAIGCLVAHALRGRGCDTTLLLRSNEQPGPRTLVVESQGRRVEQDVQVQPVHGSGSVSKLVVTTKAYDAIDAVSAVKNRLDINCQVVLLVNGMGIAGQLAQQLPGAHVFAGTTTEGAYRIAPLHIRHAGRGETRLGSVAGTGNTRRDGLPPPWFEPWRASKLSCRWDPDIEAALWSKLAVNCVINPLTAVHRCRNGELATRPELASEVDALCREVMQVSYAAGYTDTAQGLDRIVAGVIAGTADNRSSMLEDVEHARPTEIDYITGYLLDVADRHGIVAPRNRELYERVKDIA